VRKGSSPKKIPLGLGRVELKKLRKLGTERADSGEKVQGR